MNNDTPNDLRGRLRGETADVHDRLDQRISEMELSTPLGLGQFLSLQATALSAIMPLAGQASSAPVIQDLMERASRDLAGLGITAPGDTPPLGTAPHPLAVDYVIAGSRLGTKFLRQRWLTSDDPKVQMADAYFTAPDYIDHWRHFCQTASAIDASCAIADTVVADAISLFELYLTCAASLQLPKTLSHA